MKKMYVLYLVIVMTFSSCGESKKISEPIDPVTSTYYFIRHAEKDRSDETDRNPHLMDIGVERAEKWSAILGNVKFDAVYSTNYNRTKETAKPTATKNNVEVIMYDPSNIDGQAFIKDNKGKTVLVVGHSNTTPAFVNAILGSKKYQDIDDNNNGNLYIISIVGDKITDQLLVIN